MTIFVNIYVSCESVATQLIEDLISSMNQSTVVYSFASDISILNVKSDYKQQIITYSYAALNDDTTNSVTYTNNNNDD